MNTARNLLLISASRADNTPYLEHARTWLTDHIGHRELLFIPYAGVTLSHEAYTGQVRQALAPTGIQVRGIEDYADARQAVENAAAIAVGGGNTFVLLNTLYRKGLLDPVRRAVRRGVPYAGWSAGSNIAGGSIRTTNDMPIVQPPSFKALSLVPFQLNPHYSDYTPPGFHGETRDQRLKEFTTMDTHTPVIAIQEGSALKITGSAMTLLGNKTGYVFHGATRHSLKGDAPCSQWL